MIQRKYAMLMLLLGISLVALGCQSSEKDGADNSSEAPGEMTNQQPSQGMMDINTLSPSEKDDGWTLLFDGQTPGEHWRGYCKEEFPDQEWTVEDGAIKVEGSGAGEAGGGGDIITRQTYRDFELTLEWKVEKGGLAL